MAFCLRLRDTGWHLLSVMERDSLQASRSDRLGDQSGKHTLTLPSPVSLSLSTQRAGPWSLQVTGNTGSDSGTPTPISKA